MRKENTGSSVGFLLELCWEDCGSSNGESTVDSKMTPVVWNEKNISRSLRAAEGYILVFLKNKLCSLTGRHPREATVARRREDPLLLPDVESVKCSTVPMQSGTGPMPTKENLPSRLMRAVTLHVPPEPAGKEPPSPFRVVRIALVLWEKLLEFLVIGMSGVDHGDAWHFGALLVMFDVGDTEVQCAEEHISTIELLENSGI